MKRVTTLDFLRGIAVLGVVAFHAFDKTVTETFYDDLWSQPLPILVPVLLILQVMTWRGFFLIISGATLTYRTMKAIESGKNATKLLFTQLGGGILLFIHGMIIQVFWNPYWGFYDWVVYGLWEPQKWITELFWGDAVEIIALCMIISSIQTILLLKIKGKKKSLIISIYYLVFGFLIIAITPLVQNWVFNTTGFTIRDIKREEWTTFGHNVKIITLGLLVGEQQPLFPYLGVFYLGNIIGVVLAQPKLKKRLVLRLGYVSGLVILLIGIGLWIAFYGMQLNEYLMIPDTWMLLVYTGCQILVLFAFLQRFEFNKKVIKRTGRTKIIRRAGMLSLTLFTFQSINFIPRWLLTQIFGVDFLGHRQATIPQAILCGLTVLVFWIILILVFGLVRNYGTVDWFFSTLRKLIFGSKVYWKDPLNAEQIIHHPDPLCFVEPVAEPIADGSST